jgi:hypothetical protein
VSVIAGIIARIVLCRLLFSIERFRNSVDTAVDHHVNYWAADAIQQ